MDSAVKQLKVPELRRILADAGVAASPRAKKDALVNAVINDKNALELFSTRHCQPPDPTTVPDAPAPTRFHCTVHREYCRLGARKAQGSCRAIWHPPCQPIARRKHVLPVSLPRLSDLCLG